jgi:hypothetical protein
MPGGLGPRFALEAGFLILLAAVATYARLDATEIILVMAGGWVLASIFEVLAARRERVYPGATWERRIDASETPAHGKEPSEERRLSWFRRPAEAIEPAVDEAVVSEPSSPLPPSSPQLDDDSTGEIERPKRRRWFRRSGPEPEPTTGDAAARPSARHVRLIKGSTPDADRVEQEKDAEAGT